MLKSITCVGLVLLVGLVGCASPVFVRPDVPIVDQRIAQLPTVPEFVRESLDEKVNTPIGQSDVTAWSVEIPADPRIAILPVEIVPPPPGAGGLVSNDTAGRLDLGGVVAQSLTDAEDIQLASVLGGVMEAYADAHSRPRSGLQGHIERELPFLLLGAGYSRLLGAEELRSIHAQKEAERGGTVTWTGSMARVMQVEPVAEVDLLLGVTVIQGEQKQVVVELGYSLASDDYRAYQSGYQAFDSEIGSEIDELERAISDYEANLVQAHRSYEADGGAYGDVEEPTSGDLALAEAEGVLSGLRSRLARLAEQQASVQAPDDLAEAVANRTDHVEASVYDFSVQARLIEARTLRVLWLGRFETRRTAMDTAVGDVLDRLVDEVVELVGRPAI